MSRNPSIWFHGDESHPWSIVADRTQLERRAVRCGFRLASNWMSATILYSVWWNQFVSRILSPRYLHPRIVLTASNFIDPANPRFDLQREFSRAKKLNALWIAPSSAQQKILEGLGLRSVRLPFPIAFDMLRAAAADLSPEEARRKLELTSKLPQGRFVIGSFQRDSLGADLAQPKWQKGPDLLADLLQLLPPERFVLLLAGPRRHYLRAECVRRNIPFVFFGTEIESDDVEINTLPMEQMALLYRACDLYLVTSRSEGGPKAIPESLAAGCPVFSLHVGCAADYLEPDNVFGSIEDMRVALSSLLQDRYVETERRARLLGRATERVRKEYGDGNYDRAFEGICRSMLR